jgi:segregation and condensation protein B
VTDERPDSLAAQAASWVPPWERSPREPDRDYQAEAEADHASDISDLSEGEEEEVGGVARLEAETDEAGTVDDPAGVAGLVEVEDEPEVITGPDLAEPVAIAEANEAVANDAVANDAEGAPVDAPLPPDGDDAGDVFDQAADDDVSDDAEVDIPFSEEPPLDDAPAGEAPVDDAPVDDAPVDEVAADEAPIDEVAADEAPVVDAPVVVAAIPAQAVPRKRRKRETPAEETAPEEPAVEVVPMEDSELRAALEAILLVVDEPAAELQLAQIVEEPVERVGTMLEDISARYTAAGHGFDLRRAAGGWRLYTRPEYAAYVERFVLDGQSVRLTQAALETLAVVAYRQPVTRSRISAIRGVNCDGVMRTLATRGLIEECGTEPETGAHLYRTTTLFLEKLGLNSVDQLPPLAPFLPDDVEEVLDASG